MSLEDQIKQLELERDELLKITPLEIIKPKDPSKKGSREITTHSRIKNSYSNKIMNLKTWNDPIIREKRLKGLKNLWTPERRNKNTKIGTPEVQIKIKQTLKENIM